MIVVDTNVLLYCCIPGARNQEAWALLESDPEWAAPVLWRSEFRNVLAGRIRRGEAAREDAEKTVAYASTLLRGGEHQVSDDFVFDLIAASRCTAYDCEFVALARALDTVLVTEDKALLNAFPKLCRSLVNAGKRKR